MVSSHHGNTPAAWTGVIIAFVGFCVGAAAVVIANPVLMWVGLAIVVIGGVVGKAMQMAGLGKQSGHSGHSARSSRPAESAESGESGARSESASR